MPEGHIVHRLARRYSSAFRGHDITVTSPQGRFVDGAREVSGRRLVAAEAYGKHLFLVFDNDRAVHVHLGLYGKATFGRHPAPSPVGLVRMRLEGGRRWADLRGPTACDVVLPDEMRALIDRLGPDPIRSDADPERAWRRVTASRAPIGSLLMDQSVFAGCGNIYRAEVLFRARINPYRESRSLTHPRFDALWDDLAHLMKLGVRRGQIDTVRPEHEPEAMGREPRQDAHGGEVYVYRRNGQPCLVCGTKVRMADMQGRALYWCGRCQRR